MPYFEVSGESIYDKLRSHKFHLLIFSDTRYMGSVADIKKIYGYWLEGVALPQTEAVVDAFDVKDSFSVLLRPDNYIGFVSTSGFFDQRLSEQLEQ